MKMSREGLRWAGRAGGGGFAARGYLGVPGLAITATALDGAGGACSVAGGKTDSRRSTDGH
jgi:hypothetical protein